MSCILWVLPDISSTLPLLDGDNYLYNGCSCYNTVLIILQTLRVAAMILSVTILTYGNKIEYVTCQENS